MSSCERFFGLALTVVRSMVTLPLAVLPWVEAMPGRLFDALWFACAAMALLHLSMAFWLSDGKPHIVVAWVSSAVMGLALMGLALLQGVATVGPPAVWEKMVVVVLLLLLFLLYLYQRRPQASTHQQPAHQLPAPSLQSTWQCQVDGGGDGRSCLLCNGISTIYTSQIVAGFVRGTCGCPTGSGQVLVERDENGALLPSFECRRCPTGQQPSNGVCVDCSDALMQATATSGYVCACPSPAFTNRLHTGGLWGRDESCVYQPEGSTRPDSIRLDFKKDFDAILPGQGASLSESVTDSIAIMQLFEPNFAACRRAIAAPEPNRQTLLAGTRACQAVGNLCVLANYDEDNYACKCSPHGALLSPQVRARQLR